MRLETRVELKRLHQSLDVTTIYVTHDQEEAMTIADRMAIFFDGAIVQIGTPEEVFNRLNAIDVAAVIGSPPMNLMPGRPEGRSLAVGDYRLELPQAPEASGDVIVSIHPSHLRLIEGDGIPAKLLLSENLRESMLLNLSVGADLVKVRLPEVRRFAGGRTLCRCFEPLHVHLFNPGTRRRIA